MVRFETTWIFGRLGDLIWASPSNLFKWFINLFCLYKVLPLTWTFGFSFLCVVLLMVFPVIMSYVEVGYSKCHLCYVTTFHSLLCHMLSEAGLLCWQPSFCWWWWETEHRLSFSFGGPHRLFWQNCDC